MESELIAQNSKYRNTLRLVRRERNRAQRELGAANMRAHELEQVLRNLIKDAISDSQCVGAHARVILNILDREAQNVSVP